MAKTFVCRDSLLSKKLKEATIMKKTLALVLTLALALGMASTAFAAPVEEEKGAGTIEFRDGKEPEIIDPPPELEDWGISHNLNLDFGVQTITGTNQRYSSYKDARSEDTRLAGIVILNESTQANWVLQVGIGGFTIGTTPTMDGFELELVPRDANTTRPLAPQTVHTVTLEAGVTETIMTITPVSTIGANWEGYLDVLGGSVLQIGEARAEMIWSIVNAP